MKIRTKGFTLAELLVVVAIVGVLVAISVPVFVSHLDKARATTCEANRTTLKHHILADYMSGDISEIDNASLQKYTEKDDAKCPSGGTYTVTGDLEDGTFSVKCSKHSASALDSFISLTSKVEEKLSGSETYHSGDKLIEDVIAENGKLPSFGKDSSTWSSLFGSSDLYSSADTLYWRPKVINVDGNKVVMLYANTQSSGTAGWKGYACYYNGTYYASSAKSWNNKTNETGVPTSDVSGSLDSWLTEHGWTAK